MIIVMSCSKKHTISENPVTDNLSISSIAESEDDTVITEGNSYFVTGNYNTAIEYYQDAMQLNKAVALYNIGVSYYILGNIVEAEKNFREAIEADPKFDEAVMNLVAVLAQQERNNEAEYYLSRIIKTNKSARVYVDMANIYLRLNDTPKALYYYRLALDSDPEIDYVRSNYANFLISIGEYQDGIDILETFMQKDFFINYNLANAYNKLGDQLASYTYANEALYSPSATEEGYNKLAYLFYDLKRYKDEAQTLQLLISKDPNKEYRSRVATSYINLKEYTKALDEITLLLKLYPDNFIYNILYYEVLILDLKVFEAGKYIRSIYSQFGGDIALYYYVKHVALYEVLNNDIKSRIFINRNSEWLNLARTVYSLRVGDIAAAKRYIDKVTPAAGHDYYSYLTYINIVDKNFLEADKLASKMNSMFIDTFWYRTVIAWNLKQPDKLLKIALEFKDNTAIQLRSPALSFTLIPRLDDMSYTFKFENRGVDIASMMAFPVFLNPDEIVQFLIKGRDTLNNIERQIAIDQLEAMKSNNEGIDAFQEYDFNIAIKKFIDASEILINNPKVSYNIGLSYFNLGNNQDALEFFNKAIIQNRNTSSAHLGLGLIESRLGNNISAGNNYKNAISTAEEDIFNNLREPLESARMVYLALLASDRFNKLDEAKSIVSSNDGFVFSAEKFMQYTETKNIEILDALLPSPVFRVNSIKNLLMLQYVDLDEIDDEYSPDIYYTLAKKYIMIKKGLKKITIFPEYMKNKVYLKDMVYNSIYVNNKEQGLKFLQLLSDRDFRYPELYKASLYYFLWLRDFVNAEASVGSLDRMGYTDKIAMFYKLLYNLINYNSIRLNSELLLYEDEYTEDYKSTTIASLYNLSVKDINAYYDRLSNLIATNPYMFDTMFIEVNFEKF